MKLLLVEDVLDLAELTRSALVREGFAVDVATNAADAMAILGVAPPDVIILDLGLPDLDGAELLRSLRRRGSAIPILVVTARGGLNDKVEGLDGGADDYLVKPVAPAELAARCRALLRRPQEVIAVQLQVGNVTFDPRLRKLKVGDNELTLARREAAVLESLVRQSGRVVLRSAIENSVYALEDSPGPNALEATISRLRKALQSFGANAEIHTIRGIGYLLRDGLQP